MITHGRWNDPNRDACVCVSDILTGLDLECEGVLLLDGVSEEEASVAAVVRLSISGQHVGEVQVSVQTHGHSLVLRDGTHGCRASRTHRDKTHTQSPSEGLHRSDSLQRGGGTARRSFAKEEGLLLAVVPVMQKCISKR